VLVCNLAHQNLQRCEKAAFEVERVLRSEFLYKMGTVTALHAGPGVSHTVQLPIKIMEIQGQTLNYLTFGRFLRLRVSLSYNGRPSFS
jgi:hypothetical protein